MIISGCKSAVWGSDESGSLVGTKGKDGVDEVALDSEGIGASIVLVKERVGP